jgi:hypothetical protein
MIVEIGKGVQQGLLSHPLPVWLAEVVNISRTTPGRMYCHPVPDQVQTAVTSRAIAVVAPSIFTSALIGCCRSPKTPGWAYEKCRAKTDQFARRIS